MSFLNKVDVSKIKKSIEEGAQSVKDGVKSVDMGEIAQSAKELASSGATSIVHAVNKFAKNKTQQDESKTSEDFVALLWYLAHIDEEITAEEEAKIEELASCLDEDFDSYSDRIKEECSSNLDKYESEFGRLGAAKLETKCLIERMSPDNNEAKLLCWNLLAIANSDSLDERELDFIRFSCGEMGIDIAIFEELRSYCNALIDIQNEEEALRASDRRFAVIDPVMKELSTRKEAIIEAAQALIMDN